MSLMSLDCDYYRTSSGWYRDVGLAMHPDKALALLVQSSLSHVQVTKWLWWMYSSLLPFKAFGDFHFFKLSTAHSPLWRSLTKISPDLM